MRSLLWGLTLLMVGCTTTTENFAPQGIQPAQLSQSADPGVKGRDFTWGGSIISVKNLKDRTLLEIMAYPLDSKGVPNIGGGTQGRFIADRSGFLEPAEYPAGSLVTVTGSMLGYTDGKVGEAVYRYPALNAIQIKRWLNVDAQNNRFPVKPNVNIGFGFGSGGYSNVGIGIGF
jgi:outer membrane lipoprotein